MVDDSRDAFGKFRDIIKIIILLKRIKAFGILQLPDLFVEGLNLMQRHMQTISFLVIIAVLLGCGFLFSQQSNLNEPDIPQTETPVENRETVADIPDCSKLDSLDEVAACYDNAVAMSNRLVNAALDAILDIEFDPDERIAFMDVQLSWEKSRDADCAFVYDREEDMKKAQIEEAICLTDHNLSRLALLEKYYCEWYTAEDCREVDNTGE
jgi:uncharacterized protein YecT (DUF1311 family)